MKIQNIAFIASSLLLLTPSGVFAADNARSQQQATQRGTDYVQSIIDNAHQSKVARSMCGNGVECRTPSTINRGSIPGPAVNPVPGSLDRNQGSGRGSTNDAFIGIPSHLLTDDMVKSSERSEFPDGMSSDRQQSH